MPELPRKIYLTRAEVITAVGGRSQLEMLEAEKKLTRHFLPGYKRAHYQRAQVKRVLDGLWGGSS